MHIDTAWAIGLFEGEGCIVINRRYTGRYDVRLDMTMTDRDVMERFVRIFGSGHIIVKPPKQERYKVAYHWTCGRMDVVEGALIAWLPLLGERRAAKANEALEAIAYNRSRPAARGKASPNYGAGIPRGSRAI